MAQLKALLMFGSDNKDWVVGVHETVDIAGTILQSFSQYVNTGTTAWWDFVLPIPYALGSLKLYVDAVKVCLTDADATDYITDFYIFGLNQSGRTEIDSDPANKTSPDEIDYTFTATDVSGYYRVMCQFKIQSASAAQLDIAAVAFRCYYST